MLSGRREDIFRVTSATVQPDKTQRSNRDGPRYYRPFTAHPLWLAVVLVIILGCIAVLETAFRQGSRINLDHKGQTRRIKRGDTGIIGAANIEPRATSTTLSSSSPTILVTGSAAPESYILLSSTSASNAYITLISSKSTNIVAPTLTAGAGSYITLITVSPTVKTTRSTDTAITDKPVSAASAASGDYVAVTLPPSNQPSTKATELDSDATLISASSAITAYISLSTSYISSVSSIASSMGGYITLSTDSTALDAGKTTAELQNESLTITASAAPSMYVSLETLADGSVITHSPTNAATTPLPTRPAAAESLTAEDLQIGNAVTPSSYFNASYLAILVAVILKSIWSAVFASLKMMEPFYQLSKPGGVSAERSLLSSYLSACCSISNLRGIFRGQWVMLLATLIYVCMAVLAPLATGSMTVVATAYCPTASGNKQPCAAIWVMNATVARALQGILGAIAVFILSLIVLSWRRKSGVFCNPSSIASIAAIFSNDEILTEIRAIDPGSTDSQVRSALSQDRYMLTSYETNDGQLRYGLAKDNDPINQGTRSSDSTSSRYSSLYSPSDVTLSSISSTLRPHGPSTKPTSHHNARDGLFLFYLLAFFGIILAYYLDGNDDSFNRFFNSGTFGPRFIVTSAAVIVDCHWKTLEREVRIMTPYRRLAHRNAKPENTILVSLNGTALTGLPLALWRREWFHACIAAITVLADILIIAVAGVPFSHAQIWQAFLVSAYISLGILSLMILAVLGIFWWRRSNDKLRLPRQEPDTIFAVLMMLCDKRNGVRKEFEGLETASEKERDMICTQADGRYWAGWVRDGHQKTGQWRWCVEKEEERSYFK